MTRVLAAALSLCLPLGAAAQAPATPTAEVGVSTEAPSEAITVTAPRQKAAAAQSPALKAARAGGVGMAAGGLGIFAYAVIFGAAGPIGWAAALVFVGGMTAYLSHRTLQGHDDFSPDEARKGGAAPSRP